LIDILEIKIFILRKS